MFRHTGFGACFCEGGTASSFSTFGRGGFHEEEGVGLRAVEGCEVGGDEEEARVVREFCSNSLFACICRSGGRDDIMYHHAIILE